MTRGELLDSASGYILHIYQMAPVPPGGYQAVTPLDHQPLADLGVSKPCDLWCALTDRTNLLPTEKTEAVSCGGLGYPILLFIRAHNIY